MMHESQNVDCVIVFVVELRQRLVKTWTEFQRSIVGETIEQCRTDSAVVSAQREVTSNTFYKK